MTATGSKAFVFEGKLNRQTIRRTIGDVRSWSIEQARTEARRLAVLIDEGVNPNEQERQARAEAESQARAEAAQAVTVGEVWQRYIEARRPHWGALTLRDHLAMVAPGGRQRLRGQGLTEPGPLVYFVPMQLGSVTPAHVQAWADAEAIKRPTRARLALRLLRAFFNWCIEQPDITLADNPVAGNRAARQALGTAKPKQDALLREQLPAWFAAVCAINNPAIAAYLQCLLLTGARPGELLALQWQDVDTQWRGLTIRDKAESAGGQDGQRIIPLTPFVHALIAALPRRGQYVFSSDRTDGPITTPTKIHATACTVAGVEVTLHGLRRSFGSLAEWLELPAGVVAQVQGHKPSATAEKHYRVRPLDLLRLHHEKLEAWILEQAGIEWQPQAQPQRLRVVAG